MSLRLATGEYLEGKEITEWRRVIAWGATAALLDKHVKKGDAILITGQNRTRSYERVGQSHYVTEVVMRPTTE